MMFVLIVRKLLFKINYLSYPLNHMFRGVSVNLFFFEFMRKKSEGYFEHWKAISRIPCKVCGKPTSSDPGLCRKHANGYYVTQYINRLQDRALGTYLEV